MPPPTGSTAYGRDDEGVSLVEVMVAMGVFVVASLSLLSVLSTSMRGSFDNRARITAAQVAASDIDKARAKGAVEYSNLAGDTYDEEIDGRTYTVKRQVVAEMSDGATSSCVGSSARQLYKKVTTTVTTPRGRTGGVPADPLVDVRADTLVKAPVYDPTSLKGAIGLVVIDRSGNPLANLTAHAGGLTRKTDSKGCAFFDELPVGTHTATVTRADSVTIAGSFTLSRDVTVGAGQITSQVLRIDTAVNLTVNASRCCTAPVTDFVRPTGLAVTLSSPDRTSPIRIDYPSKPVVGGDLVWPAFPSPAGYEAYLGPCQTPKRTDSEPGTTPPKVLLPLSTVTVKLNSGNASAGIAGSRRVKVLWRGTNCLETLTFDTITAYDCKPDGRDHGGCNLHLAVPAGIWRFELDGYPQYFRQVAVAEGASQTVTIAVP